MHEKQREETEQRMQDLSNAQKIGCIVRNWNSFGWTVWYKCGTGMIDLLWQADDLQN